MGFVATFSRIVRIGRRDKSEIALETTRQTLTATADVITSDATLTGRIGRAVLDDLLPPRRPRVSVRKVKSPLSRWNKADPHRPARTIPVTDLTVTVKAPKRRLHPRHAETSA